MTTPTRLAATLAGTLDRVLDRSVVGYTRFGPLLRRRWWPADPAPDALRGRAVAVTGANSGLGKATALGAARLGAEVWMLCRDIARAESARTEITEAVPAARVHVLRCDVSDLAGLLEVARELVAAAPRLHGLVHNAGVLPEQRTQTADRHELALATHVLGPHLLTAELRGALAADGDARVVFMTSGGMYTRTLRMDDPEYARGRYSGTEAYARTKRMQVHLAEEWAQRLLASGVVVHSTHPGWAATPGLSDSLPGFSRLTGPLLRSAEDGADTAVWLLAADEARLTTGLLWHDREPRPTAYLRRGMPSRETVRGLWDYCEQVRTAT